MKTAGCTADLLKYTSQEVLSHKSFVESTFASLHRDA